MHTYKAMIKLPSGGRQWVEILANSYNHAKQILDMQYGPGSYNNLCQSG